MLLVMLAGIACAQRIAILAPDKSERSLAVAAAIEEKITKLKIVDSDLAMSAFNSAQSATPFNMTAEESRRVGALIGCDVFVIVRSVTQRRIALGRSDYFEAFAVIYLVSSRSGHLVDWQLVPFEGANAAEAERKLETEIPKIAERLTTKTMAAVRTEIDDAPPLPMEEVPKPTSPEAKNFKAPIPFRRIKPEYISQAAFYEVAATVEIIVDLDASGKILRTEIVRWAGFGLDESVEKTVRMMKWRAAERAGKSLPMRFLLRYNFKKIDKESP